MKKELDVSSKENVAHRGSIDDFKKKLEEAKKNQQRMGVEGEAYDQRGHAIQRRPGAKQNQSRASRTQNFFQTLQMSGFKQGKENDGGEHMRKPSGYNASQVLNQLQANEDVFISTISELQADRMRIKGKDMLSRLSNLQREQGAFNTLVQQMRSDQKADHGEVAIKLNRSEQTKVEEALESVETLKFKVKKQMAARRVVDLSKPLSEQGSTAEVVQAAAKLNTESQNYLVVEAREKINEAIEVLFTKDSRLRKLQLPKPAKTDAEPNAKPEAEVTQQNLNEIKIGQFKLKGKIKVPNRRIIMDDAALS